MNGYNPNYFDRKLVNSMKNAISQIVVKEAFQTTQGQPGLGIQQISDLELKNRMRDKKNTSIFNKNPKQSKEYLELEAEANRRAAAKTQTQAPTPAPAIKPPAPTQVTPRPTPISTINPNPKIFRIDPPPITDKKPGPSALPTNKEIQKTQTTADTTGIPTALPTNVTPGTVGMTDMDGNPIVLQPTKPRSISAPKPNLMSNVPGKSYRDRFSMGIGNITVPNAQLQSFKQAKETAAKQNTSGMGAYSPKDTNSQVRGEVADWRSGFDDTVSAIPAMIGTGLMGAAVGALSGGGAGAAFGGVGAIPGAVIGAGIGGVGALLSGTPKSKPINATKVQGPAPSQQEIPAAQNAAPAPANWTSNYAARVAAARARAKR